MNIIFHSVDYIIKEGGSFPILINESFSIKPNSKIEIYLKPNVTSLKNMFFNAYVKIIKFRECPHPIVLEKEVWIAISQLDYIIKKVKNLTLKVSKKKDD